MSTSLALSAVLLALVSCPVASQVDPITIVWSSATLLTPTRGMGCGAYKLSNQPSLSARFQAGHDLNTVTNSEFEMSTDSSYSPVKRPYGNNFPAREGHAYLNSYTTDGQHFEVVWGGMDGTGNLLNDVWSTPTAGYQQGKKVDSTFTPRFNMSYTQVLDFSSPSPLVVGVSYGGVVSDGQGGLMPTDDIFVISATDGTLKSQGVAPFGARTGMSMSSFNSSAGVIVLTGGVYWPQDPMIMPTFYNDVWVNSRLGEEGSWLTPSTAPFSPRWGHLVFAGGRQDLIVQGGYGTNGQWINDAWYAQFLNPLDSLPTWTQLSGQATGGAPTDLVGCTMEYWSGSGELQLIAMGSPSGNAGANPSDGLWIGEVTDNS